MGDVMNQYQILGHCIKEKLYVQEGFIIDSNDIVYQMGPYTFLSFEIPQSSLESLDIYQRISQKLSDLGYDLEAFSMVNYPDILELLTDHEEMNWFHHIIYEKNRMDEAKAALLSNDFKKLGRLMRQSYLSYQTMVQATHQIQDFLMVMSESLGAIGANIHGSILTCMVESSQKDRFTQQIQSYHQNKYKGMLKKL
jgi:galactokinase